MILKVERQRDEVLNKVAEIWHQHYETETELEEEKLEEEKWKNIKPLAQFNYAYDISFLLLDRREHKQQ